jgi:hypothetical protein
MFDRAVDSSPSIEVALTFTGGGYFDYMGKRGFIAVYGVFKGQMGRKQAIFPPPLTSPALEALEASIKKLKYF